MGFDQDGLVPGTPAPFCRLPLIAGVVDHLARAVDILRLEVGGGIGHVDRVIDPEFVAAARAGPRNVSDEPAVGAPPHRMWLVQQQINPFGSRRPQAKRRAPIGQPCAELPRPHVRPMKARTERGGALVSAPESKSTAICFASVVFNTCRQLL